LATLPGPPAAYRDAAARSERTMIRRVNDALLEMQGALLARSLYPEGHPRVHDSERRALELLSSALDERAEVALFALEGRVIFEGETLPACAALSDTLFRMLRAHGIDRVIFRSGIAPQEISSFLDQLADGESAGRVPMRPSSHVRLSSLQPIGFDGKTPEVVTSSAVAYAERAADVLPGIWEGLYADFLADRDPSSEDSAGRRFDPAVLGDIVSSVSRVVAEGANAMLPLAPLKKHDEYTFVHTINVAVLSTALGEALGFNRQTAHDLNIAALLHDVGKQIVPYEVLNKAGRFDEEERQLMQLHPVEGARMLLNTPGVPDIAPIVAYEHHIRADGSGYPRVPAGWRLSLASRVVQLADVFDALRTNRPYRHGLPVPKIVEMMRNDAGTFFDADLLQIFFESVISRGIPDTESA